MTVAEGKPGKEKEILVLGAVERKFWFVYANPRALEPMSAADKLYCCSGSRAGVFAERD